MSVDLSQLTALVTTSDEPKAIGRLLQSATRFFPTLKLLIATADGQLIEGATVVKVADSEGVNAARNAMLARVRTRYILLLNDRIELTRKSNLDQLLTPVVGGALDLAGGELLRCRKKLLLLTAREAAPAHGTLDIEIHAEGDRAAIQPGCSTTGEGYSSCDVTHSFFVARTDKLRAMGGWPDASKHDEPAAFFVRAKRFGLTVGYCSLATASFWPGKREASLEERREATCAALAEASVSRLVDADGQVYEAAVKRAAQAA